MPPTSKSKRIFLAPAPRAVSDIFEESDLIRLRALGDLVVHEEGPITDKLFEATAAETEIIIGQIDLPESRLRQEERKGRQSKQGGGLEFLAAFVRKSRVEVITA